jgi:hypothetical protein
VWIVAIDFDVGQLQQTANRDLRLVHFASP